MGYEWDIFLSYPRRDPVGPWVTDHFFPMLQKWMGAAMQQPPKLFLDREMDTGTRWPDNLEYSLQRSRYMVAVWAPPYFGSEWCLAEWKTIVAREEAVGRVGGKQIGLVFPIRFFDGESFPEEGQRVQARPEDHDYTPFNAFPAGKQGLRSRSYRLFEEKVKVLACVLAERVQGVPPWQDGWPIKKPQAPQLAALRFQDVQLR